MADQKSVPCPKSNEFKPIAPNAQGDGVGNMKSEISASRVNGELDFEVFSADSKHEVEMQSSDGIGSAIPTSMKSDISTETGLPLSSESFEIGVRRTRNLNASEDGLNPWGHDLQQRTESSCSNSLSTVLPVQFSNQSYRETSKEMCCFRNCVVSTDSSNTKSFECRLQEPVSASSESAACQDLENLNTPRSVERLAHLEVSGEECKDASTVKTNLLKMVPEVNDKIKAESWANEPSEYSMMKPGKVALENQEARIAGFDLNEDLNANGIDDCAQPPAAMAYFHGVIQVVAKAGRPNGQPEIPLRFEGRLDWKGTGESSAFRPAGHSRSLESKSCSRNNEPKDPQGFMGIDLNVAVEEDNSANGIPMEHQVISSSSPLQDSHLEAGLERPKSRPFFDLNCLDDGAADDFVHPSQPPESGNPKLNTNSNTLIGDKSNILHQPSLVDHRTLGNNADSANTKRHYFNFIGHDYFSNAQIPVTAQNILQPVEFMQRVASLQPKLPLGSPALNLQNPLPTNICLPGTVVPYARYHHEQAIYPALLNPGMVHTSFCTPQLVQIVHEQGFNNLSAASFPSVNARTGDSLSTSRIKMDEVRQFPFITSNPPTTGERTHQQQHESWYDGSMKRKQPEGGYRHYHQLGYK